MTALGNNYKFEVFKANNGQWAWHFVAPNGRKVAWSGETYHNKTDAYGGIELVKKFAPAAKVVELTSA